VHEIDGVAAVKEEEVPITTTRGSSYDLDPPQYSTMMTNTIINNKRGF
jgi:hypothetical protein